MTRTTIRSEDITAGQVPGQDNLQTDIAILGFKVAANGSLAAYNLHDQTVDSFEDASGVDASGSTNEIRNASNYYSGGASGGNATGGTITTSGGQRIHSFTADGSFVVPSSGTVSWLVVGGGGAAGADSGGGGGGGGFRTGANHSVSGQSYSITVGAGGVWSSTSPTSGGNSTFDTVTSSGGGHGGNATDSTSAAGANGGSGGGARRYYTASGGSAISITPISGETTTVQGYAGGASNANNGSSGGGGAGQAGDTAGGGGRGGYGGYGVASSITGASVTYAGGGGGASEGSPWGGAGGTGGGGDANMSGQGTGTSGTDGLGGGGGGGYATAYAGGDGGDGIVIISYADGAFASVANLTLVSNATTAEAVPTKGDVVMTYTNGAGTATVNTDLKAWISRDNGTTYTQATLSSEGTTGGHTILTAHNVDISSQPSGTSMRYKIETLNQSASKETRIQAVSLGWS